MGFKLIGEFLLVEMDKTPEKSGMIFLPDGSSTVKTIKCTIRGVGIGVKPEHYKVGDRLIKVDRLGYQVHSYEDKKDYFIIPVSNVMCKVTGGDRLTQIEIDEQLENRRLLKIEEKKSEAKK